MKLIKVLFKCLNCCHFDSHVDIIFEKVESCAYWLYMVKMLLIKLISVIKMRDEMTNPGFLIRWIFGHYGCYLYLDQTMYGLTI